MAQNALQTNGFYFSYTYDLTHSKQRLYNATPDFHQLPLHERVSNLLIFWQELLNSIHLHKFLLQSSTWL